MSLTRNTRGSLVGVRYGIARIAAQTYSVPSATTAGKEYRAFVHSRVPLVIACECPAYLFWRRCKHQAIVLKFENEVARADPEQYRRETARRREYREMMEPKPYPVRVVVRSRPQKGD